MINRVHLTIASLSILLAGCTATDQKPTLMQPVAQPVAFQESPPTYNNPGSMFEGTSGGNRYLFDDSRAKRVGDIVTIKVVESASASNSANTTVKRTSSSEYDVSSMFSKTTMPIVGGAIGNTPLLATTTDKDFKGQGSTDRKNNVTATVAARVINIMPDGLLQIQGSRETKINNETQMMIVSGIIRSRDVAPDNSILSTQLADAQISYSGKGVLSDKQQPGWMTRVLDTIWPF